MVADTLGLPVVKVAAGMRERDVAGPLEVTAARRWLRGAAPMPGWCAELLADKAARSASRHARAQAQDFEEAHADLLRAERVYRLLEDGKRPRFRGADMFTVHDVAFRAAKDLAHGGDPAELPGGGISALRVCGVAPDKHQRWLRRAAGCDGEARSCYQRAAELAAQRFEDADPGRWQR